jgi:parallel beta-helix repeat protein
MTILKTAISRTPTGGTLLIPDLGGVINIDTSGGLSAAATIDRKMSVQIDGYLKANYSAYEADPAYMFKVTAHRVTFKGTGTIEGDGAFSLTGDTTANMPGLIYVESALNFRFSGIRLLRPPQAGIHLAACTRAIVRNCEMSGGPTSFEVAYFPPYYTEVNPNYAGSAHFGIIATGGGDHTFSKIHFTKDEFNGRFINCIFPSGTYGNSNGNKTLHCIAYYPWEKLLYGYGDRQVVAGNTIYGANDSNHTEGIRIWGSDCAVYGNISDGCRDGLQILDGARNNVFGNKFKNCRVSGINVQHFTDSYTGGIDDNKIYDNYVSRKFDSVGKQFGVRIVSNTLMDVSGCAIYGNTLVDWGDTTDEDVYTIEMMALSPRNATKCAVRDNKIQSCGNGIRLTRNVGGVVDGNDFNACSSIAIHLDAGARNIVENNTGVDPGTYFLSYAVGGNEPAGSIFRNNSCTGATNVGIRNHSAFGLNSIETSGNKWTDKPLVVPFELSTADQTTTVSHGGVAPHAKIGLIDDSALFAGKRATDGYFAGRATGGNIAVTNAAGNAAAATGYLGLAQVIQ